MERTVKNYDNFFLPVDDMEEAKAFYGEILGLKIKFDFPELGMTAYSVGDGEPAVILKDVRRFPDAKPAIWFEVADVRAQAAALKERGFLTEPFRIQTGWAAEFDDPFGNRLGITDYLVSASGEELPSAR